MLSCSKRLNKEKSQLNANNDEQIMLKPHHDNIKLWTAVIRGPEGSYYDGYEFDLCISVPNEYPMLPPSIKFQSKIFHPNVYYSTGEICLDILKRDWSPAWSLHSACRAIVVLLSDPAPESPLNCDAGNILREGDQKAYRCMVNFYCREYCRRY